MEKPNKHTMILFGGVAALLLLLGLFLATRDSDQDVLGDSASYLPADNPDLNKTCSGQPVYDQIKRALFRQAAQARGNSKDEYEKLATAASVRMENPVAEGQSGMIVDCAGSLFIDLPPGIATVAGRHMLMTDVYYGVAAAGGGPRKVVQLRNAGGLIETLATLVLVPQQAAPPPIPPSAEPPVDDLAALPPANGEPAPAPTGRAQPSFDCAQARSRGEQAVCADPGLAQLDRAMAAEYQRALSASTPEQAAALRQTRDRFLGYRDRCPTSACIADSYNGRIREIRDIVSGRWQPPR